MIIVLKPGVTQKQVEDFSARLAKQNQVKVNAWYGEHSTVLGLLGDTAAVDIESIAAQDIVQSVKRVQEPFKKAQHLSLRFPGRAGGRAKAAAPRPKKSRPAHCHRNHVARPFGSFRGCRHHPGWSPEYAEL